MKTIANKLMANPRCVQKFIYNVIIPLSFLRRTNFLFSQFFLCAHCICKRLNILFLLLAESDWVSRQNRCSDTETSEIGVKYKYLNWRHFALLCRRLQPLASLQLGGAAFTRTTGLSRSYLDMSIAPFKRILNMQRRHQHTYCRLDRIGISRRMSILSSIFVRFTILCRHSSSDKNCRMPQSGPYWCQSSTILAVLSVCIRIKVDEALHVTNDDRR